MTLAHTAAYKWSIYKKVTKKSPTALQDWKDQIETGIRSLVKEVNKESPKLEVLVLRDGSKLTFDGQDYREYVEVNL